MKLGEDVQTPIDQASKSWGQQLSDIIPAILQYEQSRDLVKLNTKLIAQGRAPVSGAALAPQVNVGVSDDLQKLMMFGFIGMIGFAVFNSMMKHGRQR